MADLRQRTCCFTGHREIPVKDLPGILERTEQAVRQLIEQGVVFFGVGGAIGYDTEAAKLLFRLSATDYPQIKVILVYPFEGFTSRWSDEQRAEYGRHINYYIDRMIYERLEEYADEKGQTMTTALERILKQFFDKNDEGKKQSDG